MSKRKVQFGARSVEPSSCGLWLLHYCSNNKGTWFTFPSALTVHIPSGQPGPQAGLLWLQSWAGHSWPCYPPSPHLLFLPALCIKTHSPPPQYALKHRDGTDSSQHRESSKTERLTSIKLEESWTLTSPVVSFQQLNAELVWLKGEEGSPSRPSCPTELLL